MTEQELVEKIARAIFAAEGKAHADDERMFQPVKWEELDADDYQCIRDGYRAQARAALSAIQEAIPGFAGLLDGTSAIVPVEPTPEMIAAWYRHKNGFHYHDEPPPSDTSCYGAYRAMLSASKGE